MNANLTVAHGFTIRDLEQAARIAIAIDRWQTGDTAERYDAALYAITEHVLTAEQAPTRRELVQAGVRASDRHVAAEMHHRGYDPRNMAGGSAALPAFTRYWHQTRTPWDERLIEAVALAQIWPQLTELQQAALGALAFTGDHQAAADSLGVPLVTYSSRLRKARRAAAALWHEHETPRQPDRDKRVLARSGTYRGRSLLTETDLERLRDRRAEGATLRELAAEVGYSAGALCNLLKGKRRPAAPTGVAA